MPLLPKVFLQHTVYALLPSTAEERDGNEPPTIYVTLPLKATPQKYMLLYL